MKKFTAILVCVLIMISRLEITQAEEQDQARLILAYSESSVQKDETFKITFIVKNIEDFYGIQIDFKTDNDIKIQNEQQPFTMHENFAQRTDFVEHLNESNITYDNVFTYLITRDLNLTSGIDSTPALTLVNLELEAMSTIDSLSTHFTVTDDFQDVVLDLFSMSIKLSDSNGDAIAYQFETAYYPRVELNPGIDTIVEGTNHIDAGIQVNHANGTYDIEPINQVGTTVGSYVIHYRLKDGFGLIANSVRHVHIIDKIDVHFELNPGVTTLSRESNYTDTGCLAFNGNQSLDCQIVDNQVNSQTVGQYYIIYQAQVNDRIYTFKRIVFVLTNAEIQTTAMLPKREEVL